MPALPDELHKKPCNYLTLKKTKVIVLALQELINRNKVAALKSYKGKISLDIDIDSLRKRNAHSDHSSFQIDYFKSGCTRKLYTHVK